jgi:hypothetical protein
MEPPPLPIQPQNPLICVEFQLFDTGTYCLVSSFRGRVYTLSAPLFLD